jgi:hypothetical protein
MYSTFANKSGAIRYPAAIIPKVVAPANHKADVRVNALAVEFGAVLSIASSDKVKTPINAARCYILMINISWQNSDSVIFLYK